MQTEQMDDIKKYCSILGVQAGDSAEIVKEAFRLRIKEVHPDRESGDSEEARLLIEAYRELKNGVPRVEKKTAIPRPYRQADDIGRQSYESLYRDGSYADARIYDIISRTVAAAPKSVFDRLMEPLGQLPPSRGAEFLERAEHALQSIVRRYRASVRPGRRRASDLIRDLNQVKILYRDVGSRHPSLLSRCKYRLSQIDELMLQARSELHS